MTKGRRLLENAVCFALAVVVLVVLGGFLEASDGALAENFVFAGIRVAATAAGLGLIVWAIALLAASLKSQPVSRPGIFAGLSAFLAGMVNVVAWAIAALFMGGWAFFFVAITALGSLGLVVAASLAATSTWLIIFRRRVAA